MSRALELILAQKDAGKSDEQIGAEIGGYDRSTVSLYRRGLYEADARQIEVAVLKAYDRRICPSDGEVKRPEQCQRIALSPRPHGFPDAETLWKSCQSCPHKPEGPK